MKNSINLNNFHQSESIINICAHLKGCNHALLQFPFPWTATLVDFFNFYLSLDALSALKCSAQREVSDIYICDG